MHLLVIEDEKKTLAYLRKGLTESGFNVDAVSDGSKCSRGTSGHFARLRFQPSFGFQISSHRTDSRAGYSRGRRCICRECDVDCGTAEASLDELVGPLRNKYARTCRCPGTYR